MVLYNFTIISSIVHLQLFRKYNINASITIISRIMHKILKKNKYPELKIDAINNPNIKYRIL